MADPLASRTATVTALHVFRFFMRPPQHPQVGLLLRGSLSAVAGIALVGLAVFRFAFPLLVRGAVGRPAVAALPLVDRRAARAEWLRCLPRTICRAVCTGAVCPLGLT